MRGKSGGETLKESASRARARAKRESQQPCSIREGGHDCSVK